MTVSPGARIATSTAGSFSQPLSMFLRISIEEPLLQRHAFRQQEGEEIRSGLHAQPFVARGDAQIALDGAAQVQAEAAPVRDDERRDVDVLELRAARPVPGIVQRMGENVRDVVHAIGAKLLRREAVRARVALAGHDIGEWAVRIAVLVAQNASVPPPVGESVAEDAALPRAVAVEIRSALPGKDRRQMRRPQRGDHPLARRVIGDAQQPDLAVAPGLRPAHSIAS